MGGLFGHFYEGTLVIQGLVVASQSNPCISNLLNYVPSELELCGGFTTGDKVEEAQDVYCQVGELLQNVKLSSTCLFIHLAF